MIHHYRLASLLSADNAIELFAEEDIVVGCFGLDTFSAMPADKPKQYADFDKEYSNVSYRPGQPILVAGAMVIQERYENILGPHYVPLALDTAPIKYEEREDAISIFSVYEDMVRLIENVAFMLSATGFRVHIPFIKTYGSTQESIEEFIGLARTWGVARDALQTDIVPGHMTVEYEPTIKVDKLPVVYLREIETREGFDFNDPILDSDIEKRFLNQARVEIAANERTRELQVMLEKGMISRARFAELLFDNDAFEMEKEINKDKNLPNNIVDVMDKNWLKKWKKET